MQVSLYQPVKPELPRLRELDFGDTFMFAGEGWMKVFLPVSITRAEDQSGKNAVAVNLADGGGKLMPLDTIVEPLAGSFVEDPS